MKTRTVTIRRRAIRFATRAAAEKRMLWYYGGAERLAQIRAELATQGGHLFTPDESNMCHACHKPREAHVAKQGS